MKQCRFSASRLREEFAESVMHCTLERDEHWSKRRLSPALFGANIVGAVMYVIMASPSWAIPQERELGLNSMTGEPFVWFLGVAPIVIGFALLNLVWVAFICFNKRWRSSYFLLMAAALWIIAVYIDFAHH